MWLCVAEGPDPLTCLPSLLQVLEDVPPADGECLRATAAGEAPRSLWCEGRLGANRIYLSGPAPVSAWMPAEVRPAPAEPVLRWERGARALFESGPRGWVTGLLAIMGLGAWALALAVFLLTPVHHPFAGWVSPAQNAWRQAWLTAATRLRAQPERAVTRFLARDGFWSARYARAGSQDHRHGIAVPRRVAPPLGAAPPQGIAPPAGGAP